MIMTDPLVDTTITVTNIDGDPMMSERFRVGDVIHHRRYRYRGVIVERDAVCQADEAWYQGNQTQPDRHQPWYHVLVDGAEHTTYVAEEQLERYPSGEPVRHPKVEPMFASFFKGRYYKEPLN